MSEDRKDATWWLKVITSAMTILGVTVGLYLYLRDGIANATTRQDVHDIVEQRIEVHELKGHESTDRSIKELDISARAVERALIEQAAAMKSQTAEIKAMKEDIRKLRRGR